MDLMLLISELSCFKKHSSHSINVSPIAVLRYCQSYRYANPRVRHIPGLGAQKVPPGYRARAQITGFRNIMGDAGSEASREKILDFVEKYSSSTGFIFFTGIGIRKTLPGSPQILRFG